MQALSQCFVRPHGLGRRVALPCGRKLGFLELGDPSGRPVVYFHGFPGSRLEAAYAHWPARQKAIRLIGLDRPGYGLSDPSPGQTLVGFIDDILSFSDALDLNRFSVAGVSGGGPFALTCARFIPDRLGAAAVICGMGPAFSWKLTAGMQRFHRAGLLFLSRFPGLTGRIMPHSTVWARKRAESAVRRLAAGASPADRHALLHTPLGRHLTASLKEALRCGTAGILRDAMAFARPWGFEPEEIRMTVHVFHGMQDRMVPPSMAENLTRRIPGARFRRYADEGHFSILVNRMEDIFETMTTCPAAGPTP